MAVLVGWCVTYRTSVKDLEINGQGLGYANPCPHCGVIDTCDVQWISEEPFSDIDIEGILNDRDIPDGCNVFPAGTPGPFNPALVIFVDHPNFKRSEFDDYMRDRVKKHVGGRRTNSVTLVSRTKSSMQSKLEVQTFRKMVDEWRWMDGTFSPKVLLRTKSRSWQTPYPPR